jgi:ligand-binding sensor domain-containing protein/serine phosphatase RsbU (regulator of sigma subunit)
MRKLWLYILLPLCMGVHAQTYDFRNYNVDEGLAQSQVFCIYQDSRGYMWFGTNGGGASRFDGKKFQSFTPSNGALSNYVFSITEDASNYLYLATYDGLQITGKFRDFSLDTSKGLPDNECYFVMTDKDDVVWVGTKKGICTIGPDKKAKVFPGDSLLQAASTWTIFQDSRGDYWFGTMEHGACRYSPAASKNKFTWFTVKDGLGSNFIRSFNEDVKGSVWLGTLAGLSKIDAGGKPEAVALPGLFLSNMAVTSISEDKNHNMWLCTNEGAIKVNGLGYETYKVKNGLCSNVLLSSFIDNEGNIWFGSDGSGISKLLDEAINNMNTHDGLPGDYINCIFQSRDGRYWFGIRDNGLVLKEDRGYRAFKLNPQNPQQQLVDNNVNCISEDENGNLWAGTMAGLSIYDGKRFLNFLAEDIEHRTIYSLFHTKNGKHYIGTIQGLLEFDNGKISPVEIVNNVNDKGHFPIYGMNEDEQGNLWMATAFGVIRYDGKQAQLLNSKQNFTDKTVYNVVKDKKGHLWFGSEEGVFYYDHQKVRRLTERDGLVSNQCYFLLFDNQNRLWIGTNKGIDALNLNDYLGSGKITIKHLGKEEGLKGLECNFNAACKDKDGKLWFGTVKGITTFNPRFEKINYHEPACAITDIKIGFEKVDLSPFSKGLDSLSGLPLNLELPYSRNHVTFDFIGISQTNPAKVQYQFMLEGVDDDWVPPTTKTEVTYSSLQPGQYTFYLKAMNNDGFWNKEPLKFSFEVLPPWYRTWWFYSLCAVLALVSIYGWNSYKTKKLREDKLKLEQEVELRTKELREEKEKVEVINKEVIEQKAVIEHKNHEITDSIKYAKNIQEALLPAINALQNDFPDSFVLYLPKDIVSGDFYWFTKREGKNYFAAVDCTGHGVPGAFMSIVGNSLLTEIISEQKVYQPSEILNNLHVGVKEALNQNKGEQERRDGMDLALCAIDKATLKLEYAGANRPLWIYRTGSTDKAEIVKPDKFPIGGMEFDFEEKRRFTPHEVQLKKGDCVYVFSDGYADQFGGPKGKKFMVANLQRALAEIAGRPMREQYEHLHKIFTEWRGAYEQVDDVLVIGVRV